MKWIYFYLTALILRIDLFWGTNKKQTKCAVPEISKAVCTYYNENLYYKNWKRFLEESSEMPVFRNIKEQHGVNLSVTTGSRLMLGRHLPAKLSMGKRNSNGERPAHENLLTK